MDKRNYSAEVIGVFENIGTFFVDIFYNDLYLKAKHLVKDGYATSITDEYKNIIITYMRGIAEREDIYMRIVKKLHEYYQRISGFGTILFADFENKVLSQFIPEHYYKDFSERNKDMTLHEIVIKTINAFGEAVLAREMLSKIIDDHQNVANVRALQDRIMDIFLIQREDYYGRFVREISKSNGNDKVSKKLVEKLKAAFVEEKRKRCELETEHERALAIVPQLLNKISQLEATIAQLKSRPAPVAETQPKTNIMFDLKTDSTRTNRKPGRSKKSVPVKPRSPEPSDVSNESDDSSSAEESAYEINRKRLELIAQRKRSPVQAQPKQQSPVQSPTQSQSERESESESAGEPSAPAEYTSVDDDPWAVDN